MIILIPLAAFAVIAVELLVAWMWSESTPRRYTGKLKKLG